MDLSRISEESLENEGPSSLNEGQLPPPDVSTGDGRSVKKEEEQPPVASSTGDKNVNEENVTGKKMDEIFVKGENAKKEETQSHDSGFDSPKSQKSFTTEGHQPSSPVLTANDEKSMDQSENSDNLGKQKDQRPQNDFAIDNLQGENDRNVGNLPVDLENKLDGKKNIQKLEAALGSTEDENINIQKLEAVLKSTEDGNFNIEKVEEAVENCFEGEGGARLEIPFNYPELKDKLCQGKFVPKIVGPNDLVAGPDDYAIPIELPENEEEPSAQTSKTSTLKSEEDLEEEKSFIQKHSKIFGNIFPLLSASCLVTFANLFMKWRHLAPSSVMLSRGFCQIFISIVMVLCDIYGQAKNVKDNQRNCGFWLKLLAVAFSGGVGLPAVFLSISMTSASFSAAMLNGSCIIIAMTGPIIFWLCNKSYKYKRTTNRQIAALVVLASGLICMANPDELINDFDWVYFAGVVAAICSMILAATESILVNKIWKKLRLGEASLVIGIIIVLMGCLVFLFEDKLRGFIASAHYEKAIRTLEAILEKQNVSDSKADMYTNHMLYNSSCMIKASHHMITPQEANLCKLKSQPLLPSDSVDIMVLLMIGVLGSGSMIFNHLALSLKGANPQQAAVIRAVNIPMNVAVESLFFTHAAPSGLVWAGMCLMLVGIMANCYFAPKNTEDKTESTEGLQKLFNENQEKKKNIFEGVFQNIKIHRRQVSLG